MILTRKTGVEMLETPMTRRFCESRIMTEYHLRKPYFINANDDLVPVCSQGSVPNDEMWKKFELYLTPPSSPPRENDGPQVPEIESDSTFATLTSGFDFTNLDLDFDPKEFEDMLNCQGELSCKDKIVCDCRSEQLIKDCMWNGVGHKASAGFRNIRNNRRSSPATSHSPCHAHGCVDPRNIFPYPVGQPNCCENQRIKIPSPAPVSIRHRPPMDGAETPSDSEEEIDVVTVEKNSTVLKAKNNVTIGQKGVTPGKKILATLVPKENGKLTLVTNTSGATNFIRKGVKTITQNAEMVERGRARSKYQLVNGNGQNIPPRTVMVVEKKAQNLKEKFTTATVGSKRRHTVEETACCVTKDQQPVMQMANPKLVMQRNNSVSPVSRTDGKRRILSLDGVSFCATNGVRQYNTDYMRSKDGTKIGGTPEKDSVKIKQVVLPEVTSSFSDVVSKFKITKQKIPIGAAVKVKEEPNEFRTRIVGSPQNKRKRKAEALASVLSSGSGSDSEQIRAAHNVLERQRREGLRASFLTLRDNVPELRAMEKTPKVNILNKARDYCLELQRDEKSLTIEKDRLIRRQQRLQSRLERARRAVQSISSPPESDLESEVELSGNNNSSPIVSLPPSPPTGYIPSTNYYVTNKRSPTEQQQHEVVFRLESAKNSRQRVKNTDFSPTVKQVKCQADLRAILATLQKGTDTNLRLSFQTSDVLSDGFDCGDSEEEHLRTLF
uniref:uncharacterized protein LOC120345408 isoform X1 n=2 Tax=Styela clava TaxID=7725 RepID=UPI0019398001|nr:uncharacterized protein LOC120345408 isoform X1 [Styela clava]